MKTTTGTPDYMAPDYHRSLVDHTYSIDPGKADVFSVGCVLFQIVFGKPPFPGRNPMFEPVVERECVSLVGTIQRVADAQLKALLRRCLFGIQEIERALLKLRQ